jgi:hypothetical protein
MPREHVAASHLHFMKALRAELSDETTCGHLISSSGNSQKRLGIDFFVSMVCAKIYCYRETRYLV